MYELVIEQWFAASHNLRDYDGACERLHGHNWKVEVHIEARELDHRDIALDFKVLKKETTKILQDRLDHRYLNDIPPFDKINTTAENLAKYIYEEIGKGVNDGNVKIARVKVWESNNAAATYYE